MAEKYIQITDNSGTPTTPQVGKIKVYQEGNDLKAIDSNGVITNLTDVATPNTFKLPQVITVDPDGSIVTGEQYTSLSSAVTFCEANATTNNRFLIYLTKNITISSVIEMTNPYYTIKAIGNYNVILTADDSLAGGDIFRINYNSGVITTAPLGNFRLTGSSILKSTANTKAVNIIGEGVFYINTLRIDQFNTGIELDRSIGTTQVVLIEDNITLRDCVTGIYVDNSSVTISKMVAVDCTTAIDVQTNANLTIEKGSASGFLNTQTDVGLEATGSPEITLNNIEFSNLLTGVILDAPDIIFNYCNFDNDNVNDAIINGAANITTSSTKIDLSKVSFNVTPTINGTFINKQEGDKSFVISQELAVGFPNSPQESIFGEGDSYVVSGLFYNFNGSSYSNVKSDLTLPTDGNTWSYSALTTNNALYISNQFGQQFFGIKVQIDTAAVLGAGDIVFEYWNGSSWTEFNHMVTKSGDDYLPLANEKLESIGSYQIRFDDRIREDWAVNDPPSLGTDYYWIRLRISSTINQSPVLNQVKIHTNRTEINGDGFVEHFGLARPLKKFPVAFGSFESAANSPSNQDIYLGDALFAGRVENSFVSGALDRTGVAIALPFDIDTSCPIRVHLSYSGEGSSLGNVYWQLRWGWISDGGTIYRSTAAAPSTGINEQSIDVITAYNGTADEVQTDFIDLEIPEVVSQRITGGVPRQGDIIFITVARLGNNVSDTYGSDINLIELAFYYNSWRSGGHIKAES